MPTDFRRCTHAHARTRTPAQFCRFMLISATVFLAYSNITTEIKIKVRIVAKLNPQTMDIAMGERNRACPVAKKASGVKPPTVVTVVSKIGRKRAIPDSRIA